MFWYSWYSKFSLFCREFSLFSRRFLYCPVSFLYSTVSFLYFSVGFLYFAVAFFILPWVFFILLQISLCCRGFVFLAVTVMGHRRFCFYTRLNVVEHLFFTWFWGSVSLVFAPNLQKKPSTYVWRVFLILVSSECEGEQRKWESMEAP